MMDLMSFNKGVEYWDRDRDPVKNKVEPGIPQKGKSKKQKQIFSWYQAIFIMLNYFLKDYTDRYHFLHYRFIEAWK